MTTFLLLIFHMLVITKQETGSDVSDAAHEETEEEFLERYAQTARDLQAEACEEAEDGQDEDGHELALGTCHSTLSLFSLQHLQNLSIKQNLHYLHKQHLSLMAHCSC